MSADSEAIPSSIAWHSGWHNTYPYRWLLRRRLLSGVLHLLLLALLRLPGFTIHEPLAQHLSVLGLGFTEAGKRLVESGHALGLVAPVAVEPALESIHRFLLVGFEYLHAPRGQGCGQPREPRCGGAWLLLLLRGGAAPRLRRPCAARHRVVGQVAAAAAAVLTGSSGGPGHDRGRRSSRHSLFPLCHPRLVSGGRRPPPLLGRAARSLLRGEGDTSARRAPTGCRRYVLSDVMAHGSPGGQHAVDTRLRMSLTPALPVKWTTVYV